MKKITLKKIIAFAFCTFFFSTVAIAQQRGFLSKISLEQQIESSTQIVEGKVISKKAYWDENHQNIYTVNVVEVYKVFKGRPLATVEVITQGGFVGLEGQMASHSLGLTKNDIGIFMLFKNDINLTSDANSSNEKFKPYSAKQGFYKYNKYENLAVNPFYIKEGISSFYQELETLAGVGKIKITDFDIEAFTASNSSLAVAITNISPTTSTAGTGSVLTITGTGFGATKGTVSFRDSDFGGSSTYMDAIDSQILTWGDTEITVEIPSLGEDGTAGTGNVIVTHASDTTSATSSQTLTISYAQINAVGDFLGDGFETAYPTQHIDDDGNGGHTWQMETSFDANTAANESFMRAFDTWRCETGVNWSIGATTSVSDNIVDGINVITFDLTTELPGGVLGTCYSNFSGCVITPGGGGDQYVEWFVVEMDIIFDDERNWEFGPADAVSPKYDFETVSVHELGHGHQLGHVINSGAIMHYAIGSGTNNRTLSVDDIVGADDVFLRSSTTVVCISQPLMTEYVCSAASVDDEELARSIELYPNPATNSLQISNKLYLNLEAATIHDISGREISTTIISEYGSQIIDVSHLSKGLYFISITSDKAKITKRFIVQ